MKKYQHYRTNEHRYLVEHYKTDGPTAVAKALGRTVRSVVEYASRYGVTGKYRRPSIDSIRERCTEEGSCWIWHGAVDANGRPSMHYQGRTQYVRRVARALADEAPIPPGKMVTATCGNLRCVSPDCSIVTTKQGVVREASKRGAYSRPDNLARMAIAARARAIFTDEQVRIVREHPGSAEEAAAAVGMSAGYARAIRAGKARRELGANPLGMTAGR